VSALTNTLFSDGFESGNTTAWSGQNGPVSVSQGSALSGGWGMQATAAGAAPAYLVDSTPTNDSGYHLQFQFRPDTLATGTGTVNIATGLSTTGQTLFVVQYRKSGSSSQVRLGVRRSTGAMAYTTTWTTVVGAQTLRVDWAAGTSVTEKLTAGSVVSQITGVNTGTVWLDALWLGLSGGGTGTTGAASFDAVVSTRFTLP
jgi:hypothetical protein